MADKSEKPTQEKKEGTVQKQQQPATAGMRLEDLFKMLAMQSQQEDAVSLFFFVSDFT